MKKHYLLLSIALTLSCSPLIADNFLQRDLNAAKARKNAATAIANAAKDKVAQAKLKQYKKKQADIEKRIKDQARH